MYLIYQHKNATAILRQKLNIQSHVYKFSDWFQKLWHLTTLLYLMFLHFILLITPPHYISFILTSQSSSLLTPSQSSSLLTPSQSSSLLTPSHFSSLLTPSQSSSLPAHSHFSSPHVTPNSLDSTSSHFSWLNLTPYQSSSQFFSQSSSQSSSPQLNSPHLNPPHLNLPLLSILFISHFIVILLPSNYSYSQSSSLLTPS